MNEPLAPPQPDAAASPRGVAIGGHRVFDRVDVREIGSLHLAQMQMQPHAREPHDGQPVLLWWVDSSAIPEIAATWTDVVRAMRAVTGSNVLPVRTAGEQDGIRWMTFPYVAAETIDWVLQRLHASRTPLPWELACRVIIDAARAVDALHSCRDGERRPWPMHGALSGESFAIAFDGRTLLLDPGHLFPLQAQSEHGLPYSAPERVWSEPSDAHADVFSLGALLWELCAGRRLFKGRDDDETRALLEAHVIPELALRVRGTPPKLDALITRALARSTSDRIESAAVLVRELETLFEVGGATTAEVAKYMRTHFADRERAHRARLEAVTEVTEIRVQSGSSPSLAIAVEEATLTHQIPLPLPAASPPTGRNSARGAPVPASLDDETVPRLVVRAPGRVDPPEALKPRAPTSPSAEETTHQIRLETSSEGTGETRQISFDAKTRALPIAGDDVITRPSAATDEVDAETLPRISNIDAHLAVVLEAEELESVSDVSAQPPTHRRSDDENTNTNIEMQAQETRVRAPNPQTSSLPVLSPVPRREELTPTHVRAETRPRRGGMDVNRPSPAAGRPPTPGEPIRLNSSLPPPRSPRRPTEGGMGSRRVDAEGEGVSVRPPPPAPPPPRPPPRTAPPPAVGFVSAPVPASPYAATAPHGYVAPQAFAPQASQAAQPIAYATAPSPPPAPQHAFTGPGFPQPGFAQQQGFPPPQQGFTPQGFGPQGFGPQGFGPQGFAQPGFAAPARPVLAPAPAPSDDSTSDSSVSFGPSVPIASTVLNEPAEKVIVAPGAPGGPPLANAPPAPRLLAEPAPTSSPPSSAAETSAPREPLLLPRDPHMPAMQRALLAREAVRESDRRIALPVVVVAMVVAVGVAIGIPLLARRPARLGNVTPASASGDPSAAQTPGLASNTIPTTTLGTAPAGMPSPLTGTGPVLGTSPPPQLPPTLPPTLSTTTPPPRPTPPTITPTPTPTLTPAPAPIARNPRPAPRPAPRRPEPRPRPEPRDEEPIAPREKDPPPVGATSPPATGTAGTGKGLLTVICLPACDDVLDGTRSLGSSPVFRASVSAGTHRLTLRISDPPIEKVVPITVSADEITVLKQPMTK